MTNLIKLLREAADALEQAERRLDAVGRNLADGNELGSPSWNWSTRARKVISRGGFSLLLSDQVSADQLYDIKNFGPSTMREIREKLAKRGMYLKGERP